MEISFSFSGKKFENRLWFDKVIAMSLVAPFYVDTVYIKLTSYVLQIQFCHQLLCL